MTKLIAAVLAALVLVACSDTADEVSQPSTSDAPAGASVANEEAAPCPEATPADEAPTGPKKTPSPVEHCEGAYECIGLAGTQWFSFDGKNCKLNGRTFHADGRVTYSSGAETRWVGDYTRFDIVDVANCTRIAKQ